MLLYELMEDTLKKYILSAISNAILNTSILFSNMLHYLAAIQIDYHSKVLIVPLQYYLILI